MHDANDATADPHAGPAVGGSRKRVVVVGGGVGGLSAAARLAARGAEVTLVERGERVGGKLNRWVAAHPHRTGEHFTFDTGPSLLTLPLVFADLFHAAGVDVRDHLKIKRLDPIARFVWPDGATFHLRSDPADTLEEVRKLAPADVDGWRRLYERGRAIWDLAGDLFLSQSPEQAMRRREGEPPWKGLALLTTPFRIGMFRKYAGLVDAHVRDRRLREVLYQYATYSGASPFRAPATLACIPYVEQGLGGWYVEGGMYRIAEALRAVGESLGVTFRTGEQVERVATESAPKSRRGQTARVTGVRLASGETLPADAAVVNADVVTAYRTLIDPAHRPRRPDAALDKLEPGGSGMVLLLGVDATYPHLAHHTKVMPADYRSDLTAMFETRTVPADPCVYVCASSRTDPTQAPDGCENLFVLASAPPLHAGRPNAPGAIDWQTAGPAYRDKLVGLLETRGGLAGLSGRIVAERRFTPADLQSTYLANAGSIYGISGNGVKQAFLRPPNRDRDVSGLFFAGGATHPGGGLPLVALSGKIAAELAAEELGLSDDV